MSSVFRYRENHMVTHWIDDLFPRSEYMGPKQNGRHFADDICKYILWQEMFQ